jgi:transcription elongation factor Elf1
MKKNILFACAIIYFTLSAAALAKEDMKAYSSCSICGMRIDHSRNKMLIEYDDGTKLIRAVCTALRLNLLHTGKRH